jgi:hypothetical protein
MIPVVASVFWLGLVSTAELASRSTPARPHAEMVVVVASDVTFRGALRNALAPAGMDIVVATDIAPALDQLSSAARHIAERESASSVVWLLSAEHQSTLVTYDRDVDRSLIRTIDYDAPLSAVEATEAARTARTMLRSLRLTPDLDLPLPTAADARVVRDQAARATPPIASRPPPRFAVLGSVAGRAASTASSSGELRFEGGVAVLWRPDDLGVGLHVNVATRMSVQKAQFSGRASDNSVALVMHAPLLTHRRMRLHGLAGIAVHAAALDGEVDGQPTQIQHFDPAARLGALASYALGDRARVGLTVATDTLLLRQRYVVGLTPVLTVPRLQLSTGIAITLSFM